MLKSDSITHYCVYTHAEISCVLQEGMDTLGKEIDWLSHENSRLKCECTSHVAEGDASSSKHS